ncbi:hypothetical protein Tcan_01417 [Toxocara canis]|uniref:Transmembrane protein n=1 Tax=Toxocara canis TaxID=6265 RepID=A0A0B2W1N6_TOXCA|nr:hypothetical protein Tcan_01417 [Toxocara canis]
MRSREKFLLFLYSISIVLSVLLFYWSGVYCQYNRCSLTWPERNRQYAQIFPMCAAPLIIVFSLCWLLANSALMQASYRQTYSYLEMPTAVGCSLLAGICAVIEFHHSIDYAFLHWSEKWSFAAVDSTALAFLHAVIAFALQ